MNKPFFQLPSSNLCIVRWCRDGQFHEQLLTTPKSNNDLRNTMLIDHKVGFGEIRAVKPVMATNLFAGRGK
jgi:hypothetical protein